MPEAKKILITTERHEFFIVHEKTGERIYRNCPSCGREAEMITLDEAVSLTNKPTRKLLGLIESAAVHAIDSVSGHILVCRNSLSEISEMRMEK